MRVLVFAKTQGRVKDSFPAPRRTRARAAHMRLAATSIACAAAALVATSGVAVADTAAPYPRMAPIDAYLMDRAGEIALARSAAPDVVSRDATVLVLTRTGYETAVTGTNGFVCRVARGFGGAFDWPERWNPKILAAECLNPAAARSVLPYSKLCTAMFLAGRSTAETIDRLRTAASTKEIPPLEPGAMSYMMSKTSYLTDEGGHNMPHLMFFAPVEDGATWGANVPGSPVFGGNYWFVTPGKETETGPLPPMSVFLTGVAAWSDGTPAAHAM